MNRVIFALSNVRVHFLITLTRHAPSDDTCARIIPRLFCIQWTCSNWERRGRRDC